MKKKKWYKCILSQLCKKPIIKPGRLVKRQCNANPSNFCFKCKCLKFRAFLFYISFCNHLTCTNQIQSNQSQQIKLMGFNKIYIFMELHLKDFDIINWRKHITVQSYMFFCSTVNVGEMENKLQWGKLSVHTRLG